MDELLIDEKKYVSSKQAAKMTGYAKDYIGQLCREGRVPARLVGRSWYVLETAIQDHRFGATVVPSTENEAISRQSSSKSLPWTHQAPRYETSPSPVDLIPTLNKQKDTDAVPTEEDAAVQNDPQGLQNAWKLWFERVGDTITSVASNKDDTEPEIESGEVIEEEVAPEEPAEAPLVEATVDTKYEDQEVNIPIHTVYRMPPRELLPNYMQDEVLEEEKRAERPIRAAKSYIVGNTVAGRAIATTAIIIGIAFASVAAINSGYGDKFLSSLSQISTISGESVFNK